MSLTPQIIDAAWITLCQSQADDFWFSLQQERAACLARYAEEMGQYTNIQVPSIIDLIREQDQVPSIIDLIREQDEDEDEDRDQATSSSFSPPLQVYRTIAVPGAPLRPSTHTAASAITNMHPESLDFSLENNSNVDTSSSFSTPPQVYRTIAVPDAPLRPSTHTATSTVTNMPPESLDFSFEDDSMDVLPESLDFSME